MKIVSIAIITLIFNVLCSGELMSQSNNVAAMDTIFQFTGEHADQAWASTNDGVMGGLSQGSSSIVADGLRFSGSLSQENNGGFSSVFSDVNLDISAAKGVRLKVLGDGRTYLIRFHSDAVYRQRWPVNFGAEFQTTVGEWIEVFVPFIGLTQSWRGRQFSEYTFNAQDIRRITLMLADKQAGPFTLKVAWIAAQ